MKKSQKYFAICIGHWIEGQYFISLYNLQSMVNHCIEKKKNDSERR